MRSVFSLILVCATICEVAANPCERDLQATHELVLAQDAGSATLEESHKERIQAALDLALSQAAGPQDDSQCDALIRNSLQAWRKGHLQLIPLTPPAASTGELVISEPSAPKGDSGSHKRNTFDANTPRLKRLSQHVLLLTVPSFFPQYREPLEILLMAIKANDTGWVIDLRGNGGGSDSTYSGLLKRIVDSEIRTMGVSFRATPAQISAHESICALVAVGDRGCIEFVDATVRALRDVPEGTWVNFPPTGLSITPAPKPSLLRPKRVIVLVDSRCGSSCEQFVLAARQSSNVKLMGRNTNGALDYSNLRVFALPSGRRLALATSRSLRLPGFAIDGVGIPPDVLLPEPQNAAQKWDEVQLAHRRVKPVR